MRTREPVSIEIMLADPTLGIDASHIQNTRQMIAQYEAKREHYHAKANSSGGNYQESFVRWRDQAQTNRERWEKELAFQLEWLRRHRPDIYEEVTE